MLFFKLQLISQVVPGRYLQAASRHCPIPPRATERPIRACIEEGATQSRRTSVNFCMPPDAARPSDITEVALRHTGSD